MIMLLLVFIHFPRYLVFDLPVVSSVVGGIFIIAGHLPRPLGIPYSPSNPQLTIPEWYLTAHLRPPQDRVRQVRHGGPDAGALFLMALVDTLRGHVEEAQLEGQALLHGPRDHEHRPDLVTTAWGFYINPDTSAFPPSRLLVPPALYFASMLA